MGVSALAFIDCVTLDIFLGGGSPPFFICKVMNKPTRRMLQCLALVSSAWSAFCEPSLPYSRNNPPFFFCGNQSFAFSAEIHPLRFSSWELSGPTFDLDLVCAAVLWNVTRRLLLISLWIHRFATKFNDHSNSMKIMSPRHLCFSSMTIHEYIPQIFNLYVRLQVSCQKYKDK